MISCKSYCFQFILTHTVHQISFRAGLGAHTVSQLLSRGMEVYLPRYDRAAEQYLLQNGLYDDHLYPYPLYLTMVQDYLTEFGIPCTHLSYSQAPVPPKQAWELPDRMIYPAANAIAPYMQTLGDPDELYQLIRLSEEGDGASRNTIAAVKVVKEPGGSFFVKQIRQSLSCPPEGRTEAEFSITTCHSGDELPVSVYRSPGLVLTPFTDGLLKLLIHIDKLESAGQAASLFGCSD